MAFCVGQCGETTIIALKILGCELYNTFLFSQTCGSDFPPFFFFTIYIFDILDSSFLNFWLSQKTKRLSLCRACEEPTTPKLTVAAVVSWATQVTIWVSCPVEWCCVTWTYTQSTEVMGKKSPATNRGIEWR